MDENDDFDNCNRGNTLSILTSDEDDAVSVLHPHSSLSKNQYYLKLPN